MSLLAELRAHEKQPAEELGQWSEKREAAGDGTCGTNLDHGHVRSTGRSTAGCMKRRQVEPETASQGARLSDKP